MSSSETLLQILLNLLVFSFSSLMIALLWLIMEKLKQWEAARERMRGYVHAVFWQDLGIPEEESITYINWILDKIVRPEYLAAISQKYSLWRQDDNGQMFEVESNLDYAVASEKLSFFEAKGHKQVYWVSPGASLI